MFILVIEANANPCGIVRRVDKRQEIRISLICRPAEAHRNAADGAAAVLQINGERLSGGTIASLVKLTVRYAAHLHVNVF